jgi:hypothetical protein
MVQGTLGGGGGRWFQLLELTTPFLLPCADFVFVVGIWNYVSLKNPLCQGLVGNDCLWLSFLSNYAPLRVFIFGLLSGFDAFWSPGNDASFCRDQKSERHQDLPVHAQDFVLQSRLNPDENGNRGCSW